MLSTWTAFAHRAAELARNHGGKPIVLPTIPFGNDEQQLDQVATISITTRTAAALFAMRTGLVDALTG